MEIRNEGGIGPNDAVTSLNGLTGDITLAAGSGITITPASQILTIASTADLSVTLADVSANSLTTPNSLYTMTSGIDVEFRRSGSSSLLKLSESAGRVLIGTSNSLTDGTVSIRKTDTYATTPFGLTVHVADQGPYIAGYFNDTKSTTLPALAYFGYDNGDFSMGTFNGKFFLGAGGTLGNGTTTRMTINNTNGFVGIGTTSPTSILQVTNSDTTTFSDSNIWNGVGKSMLVLNNPTNTTNSYTGIQLSGGPNNNSFAYIVMQQTTGNSLGDLVFGTGGSGTTNVKERMRIYSGGGVNIVSAGGGTAGGGGLAIGNGGAPTYGLELSGNDPYVAVISNTLYANTNYPDWVTRKSRGTKASPTAVQTGDTLGHFAFQGNVNTTPTWKYGADISAVVNGSITTSGIDTDLVFKTSTSSVELTEVMRITSTKTIALLNSSSFYNTIDGSNDFTLTADGGHGKAIKLINLNSTLQINNNASSTSFSHSVNATNTSGTMTNSGFTSTWSPAAGSGNFAMLNPTYTINASGAQTGTFRGLYIQATETNLNGGTHILIDAQVGGVSKFKVGNSGDVDAVSYKVGGSAGASGTFLSADAKTVTVTNGIITSIV